MAWICVLVPGYLATEEKLDQLLPARRATKARTNLGADLLELGRGPAGEEHVESSSGKLDRKVTPDARRRSSHHWIPNESQQPPPSS